jgi:hypothetical protein
VSQGRRVGEARVVDLELLLKRADEEVILIVRPHFAPMRQTVKVDLVIVRTTSDGRDCLEVVRHSSARTVGAPRGHVPEACDAQGICHLVNGGASGWSGRDLHQLNC